MSYRLLLRRQVLEVYFLTAIGRRHAINEDCLAIGLHQVQGRFRCGHLRFHKLPAPAISLAVADGLGGHDEGARASQIVTKALVDRCPACPEEVVSLCSDLASMLLHEARQRSQSMPMGSTLACIVLGSDTPFAFDLGDSSIWIGQEGSFELITSSDRLEGSSEMMSACLGGTWEQEVPQPNVQEVDADSDHLLGFLATDGATDVVQQDEIEQLLLKLGGGALEKIYETALERGADDDISLLFFDFKRNI